MSGIIEKFNLFKKGIKKIQYQTIDISREFYEYINIRPLGITGYERAANYINKLKGKTITFYGVKKDYRPDNAGASYYPREYTIVVKNAEYQGRDIHGHFIVIIDINDKIYWADINDPTPIFKLNKVNRLITKEDPLGEEDWDDVETFEEFTFKGLINKARAV